VKTAYKSTAKERILFSFAGRFLLIQALEGRILRFPEPLNSRIFPLRTGSVIPILLLREVKRNLVTAYTSQ